jgi:ankyrin repeat protein
LLITKGADISLHAASHFGDLAIVKSLIEQGADINARDTSGRTALHYAVEYGHEDVVELLIANGADMNVKDKDGNAPGHVALGENNRPILELLIANGANLDFIHLSAYQGDLDKVRSFIEEGADVNAADFYGATPLHYAAVRGNKEVVELLISRGVQANTRDKNGITPQHFAAGEGHKDIVQILIANGADVNVKDIWGGPPLNYAADEGREAVVRLLLAKGADVNAADRWGSTALSFAKKRGHTEIVELLRKHGAKEDKAEVTQDNRLPILDVERKRNGTYLMIRTESIPGLLLDVWCYEDKLGDATRYEKQGGAVVLIHKLEEATVTTRFEPRQTGVDIQVHVTGPTAEAVRKVQRLNPCCQFARSAAFRSKGNYVDDFVARCFVFLDAGMTLLKDTKRIPGTRPRTDDKANYPKPWIQEYFPAWRKHPGQIKGQRGYSPDRPVYPIIGAVSRDGKYLAAIAWPETASLGQVWHHCIHPRPVITESFDAKTGETCSRGKIYLMENNEEKLLRQFKEDFPHWQRPPDDAKCDVARSKDDS